MAGSVRQGAGVRDASWYGPLSRIADMVSLAGRCVRDIPRGGWQREFVVQCSLIVTRCAFPLALCAMFISFATNVITLGNIAQVLGASDRIGSFTGLTGVREEGAWVTGMVMAGIAGTAICSDLGARKVREELDAISVLGVDYRRALVLPRVLAVTVMAPLMYLWSVLFLVVAVWVTGESFIPGFTHAGFVASFETIVGIDLYAGMLKMTLIGAVVGVVCCAKGVAASGGPAGVGRSVNQAVVISFIATWVISLVYNAFLQAAVPALQELR